MAKKIIKPNQIKKQPPERCAFHWQWEKKYLEYKKDPALFKRALSEKEYQIMLEKFSVLEKADREFLHRFPESHFLARLDRRGFYGQKKEWIGAKLGNLISKWNFLATQRVAWSGFAFGSLALLVVLFLPRISSFHHSPQKAEGVLVPKQSLTEEIIAKGVKQDLRIFLKTESDAKELKDKALVRKGDIVQLAYFSKEHDYGVILSIDGWGKVTLHYPSSVQQKPEIERRKFTLLEYAYELDDAPDFERFFFITSPTRLDTKKIVDSATAQALNFDLLQSDRIKISPNIMPQVEESTLLLIKDQEEK